MAPQTLRVLRLGSALPFAKGPHCRFVASAGSEGWNTLLKLFGRKAGKSDSLGLK